LLFTVLDADRASKPPALAPFTPLQVELEGRVDTEGITGQPPIKAAAQPHPGQLADAQLLLLVHPDPAQLRQRLRLQIEGLGDRRLSEPNLQIEGRENHTSRRHRRTETTGEHKAQQRRQQQSQPAPRAARMGGGWQHGQHGGVADGSMIGWLDGELADPWRQGNRCGVLLICAGVGYEVQLSSSSWQGLPDPGTRLRLHIHHSVREDAWTLFGFPQRHERDLFRELIAVSGVGPQMALGLLGAMPAETLIQAIVQADLRRLCEAPGVGRRTAERLSVELRKRLRERFGAAGSSDQDDWTEGLDGAPLTLPDGGEAQDLQLTLTALGYEPLEIRRALRAVASGMEVGATSDVWLRECLRWLSRDAA
jgi:Holliday junction DNA helicase RuvA